MVEASYQQTVGKAAWWSEYKNSPIYRLLIYFDFKSCMRMSLCKNYILSNPCFVLVYLQLTKVLYTAAGPTASSGDDSDDGTAEVVQVISAEHAECVSSCPASCPPEML